MNKRYKNSNEDAKYLTLDIARARYNMSKNTILKISGAAGATIRIGRVVRINANKFEEYLNSTAS